jgi:hypothetical protein
VPAHPQGDTTSQPQVTDFLSAGRGPGSRRQCSPWRSLGPRSGRPGCGSPVLGCVPQQMRKPLGASPAHNSYHRAARLRKMLGEITHSGSPRREKRRQKKFLIGKVEVTSSSQSYEGVGESRSLLCRLPRDPREHRPICCLCCCVTVPRPKWPVITKVGSVMCSRPFR